MSTINDAPLFGTRVPRSQADRIVAWGRLLVGLVIVAMLGILTRVVTLKLHPDPRLPVAEAAAMSTRPDLARRGDLLDRRGRVIATSSVGYRLFVDPHVVRDLNTVAVDISHAAGLDPVEVDRRIQERRDRRYVVIDHQLDDWQVAALRRSRIHGVGLEPRLVRECPNGELGAGVFGKVGFEHSGQSGLELLFDHRMTPEHGRLSYLRDAGRNPLWIDSVGYEPARNGDDIAVSIDLVIQEIAERHLNKAVRDFNAGGGRLVVLDCRTGELLAMCDVLVDRPGWTEQIEDPGRTHHPALGRNRCVTDPYEPGSTFKPFIWSLATSLGRATPDEIIDCPEDRPYRTPYGRRVRDTHYAGPVSWEQVLVRSLNTGMVIVSERLTHAEMRDAVSRFGFGERTNCGLPGESPGILTSRRNWSAYTQSSISFGHEIAVTPLQMVRAFSAFARDGTIPMLRITAERPGDGEYQFIQRVIDEQTALTTRATMRKVMLEGTGRGSQSTRYNLFGKSGTPQLPRKDGKGYHETRYVPSFIAGAPFDDPRVVVLCVIDDPDRKIGHFGGVVAGPVVRNVIDETLTYLGVKPDAE